MIIARLPCLAPALLGLAGCALSILPAQAQSLDGRWRGTTSSTPSGGKCRTFTFDFTVRADTVRGTASTPHAGTPVEWKVVGLVNGPKMTLIVESTDARLRNSSTRWSAELKNGGLFVEQLGSKACNPTRSGMLRRF